MTALSIALAVLISGLSSGLSSGPTIAHEAPRAQAGDSAAVAAAEAWLPYLDSADYVGAWEHAGEFARSNFPVEAWVNAMTAARARLGSLASRRLVDVAEESALPGAPPGDYVTITYESRFSSWAPATERVTLVRDDSGCWAVLGYVVSGTE